MDPYAIKMMSGTSVATHISRLHASMVAHIQVPFSEFHITVGTRRLLRSLPKLPLGSSLRLDTMAI